MHGVGGAWGAIATGIFCTVAIGGTPGLIDGNVGQVGIQAISVLATAGYSLVLTMAILFVLDKVPGLGLRVSEPDEDVGLDLAAHGERGTVGDGAD